MRHIIPAGISHRRRFIIVSAIAIVAALSSPATAQICTAPHYRWPAKIDSSLAGDSAHSVDLNEILADWDARPLTARDKCAPRAGREDSVYVVTGWVRRIKRRETDGDWHIEITEEEETPVTQCIVVEIPSPEHGAIYAKAREALNALVDSIPMSSRGDLDVPILLRFTGAAFFDGYHQTHPKNGGPVRAKQHGRCNSSVRALWELHPVYKVEAENP